MASRGASIERRAEYPLGEYPHTDLPLTAEDVEGWVACMPETALEMLSAGPSTRMFVCALCRVLRAHDAEYKGEDWLEDLWHWHGDHGACEGSDYEDAERYLRCLLIYTYAGWDGYLT